MQSTPTGKQASKASACMQSTQTDSSCMHAKQARPQQHVRTRTRMRADHHAN